MYQHLKTLIQSHPTKTCKTAELETQLRLKSPALYQELGYPGFAAALAQLCSEQSIVPVKSSGKNGRNPSLYNNRLSAFAEAVGTRVSLNQPYSIPPSFSGRNFAFHHV